MGRIQEIESLSFCRHKVLPLIHEVADRHLREEYTLEEKGKGNFVTSTDKSIEKELIRGLKALIPMSGVIAEESGADPSSDYNWIIDPIDGTTNYIFGFPYAISVALKYKDEVDAVLGAVYSPKINRTYYSCRGYGSYRIEANETERLHVGTFLEGEGIAIFGMPYDRGKTEKILRIAGDYYQHCSDLKRIGPSSLDICAVAEGRAKLYFELDLNIWDYAAGVLILTEAGGTFAKKDDLTLFGASEEVF